MAARGREAVVEEVASVPSPSSSGMVRAVEAGRDAEGDRQELQGCP